MIVADTKTIMIIAQITVVPTPTSQGNATAFLNVTLRPGKVTGDVMPVTINAVVIGTVATAAPKQTRNCLQSLFFTALIVLASTKRRQNVRNRTRWSHGLETRNMMTTTTIVDVTGTGVIATDSKIITIIVINVHASMKTLYTQIPSARKTTLYINGRAMEDATMTTMCVVVTGTVETAVDTLKDQINTGMVTARNISVSILPCLLRNVMENARCLHGVTMTIIITSVTVIGMVGTDVGGKATFLYCKDCLCKDPSYNCIVSTNSCGVFLYFLIRIEIGETLFVG